LVVFRSANVLRWERKGKSPFRRGGFDAAKQKTPFYAGRAVERLLLTFAIKGVSADKRRGDERQNRRSNDKMEDNPDKNKKEKEPTGDFRGANGDETRTFGARRGVNDRKGQRERNRQPNLREV
jgi:hypothetical protein